MPILFCLTTLEMACTNDGGDHEISADLVEWEGLMMWGDRGAGVYGQTVKDGFDYLLIPVRGSVGGGGTSVGVDILLKTNAAAGKEEIEGII